jgi:hypothetical protein
MKKWKKKEREEKVETKEDKPSPKDPIQKKKDTGIHLIVLQQDIINLSAICWGCDTSQEDIAYSIGNEKYNEFYICQNCKQHNIIKCNSKNCNNIICLNFDDLKVNDTIKGGKLAFLFCDDCISKLKEKDFYGGYGRYRKNYYDGDETQVQVRELGK